MVIEIIRTLAVRDFVLERLRADLPLNASIVAREHKMSSRNARRHITAVIKHYRLPASFDQSRKSYRLPPAAGKNNKEEEACPPKNAASA